MKKKIISTIIASAIMSASAFAVETSNSISLTWEGKVPPKASTNKWKITDGSGNELTSATADLTINRDGNNLDVSGDSIVMSVLVTTGTGFDTTSLNVWLASADISGNTNDAGVTDPEITYKVGTVDLSSNNLGLSSKKNITVATGDKVADLTTSVSATLDDTQYEDTDVSITISGALMVEASVG
ncbi:hypothetical protein L8R85_23450 [Vibrio splendidus]|uniref:Uncharacterized protein n=2 Tax=Vibrio TaxID=662 RepID=A0AA43K0R2_VIBSP|nr:MULTISPECIES: hypothetical protein [Vibrio]MDH5923973.1 hypothetical protein [Vibrio splendidus]TCM99756.1 hypothetical protein EDB35_1494 [Vibrio crassostreae]CAK3009761.1 exported hypothetical protein [Vibrio crassostreae]CAK3608910.1 exported hypothetical protein [Vibrio crassostreae]CAK3615993.1 exported hypothetical protein [Vibrio crassostreae]